MKAITRILFLDEDGNKFFGEGPYRLLKGVEESGSLRGAAASLGMAYTKALKLVKNAETALGFSLTMRSAGGKDGGGSRLTPEGEEWLERYEAYRDACVQANHRLYQQFFPDSGEPFEKIGCVILASGLGKRFGGNKLMADFHGQPMICRILDATEGIFGHRVVVTRHEDVAALCRQKGVETVLHHLPGRNDTVRLGLEKMDSQMIGCLFCPADQPLLKRETVAALALSAVKDPKSIWRPAFENRAGAPVLFPAWAFPELLSLPKDQGGGYIIKKYPQRVRMLPVRDFYELQDVDTQADLKTIASLAPL